MLSCGPERSFRRSGAKPVTPSVNGPVDGISVQIGADVQAFLTRLIRPSVTAERSRTTAVYLCASPNEVIAAVCGGVQAEDARAAGGFGLARAAAGAGGSGGTTVTSIVPVLNCDARAKDASPRVTLAPGGRPSGAGAKRGGVSAPAVSRGGMSAASVSRGGIAAGAGSRPGQCGCTRPSGDAGVSCGRSARMSATSGSTGRAAERGLTCAPARGVKAPAGSARAPGSRPARLGGAVKPGGNARAGPCSGEGAVRSLCSTRSSGGSANAGV